MAGKAKEPKEKNVPQRCICGQTACVVKWHGKKMVCCPDTMNCAVRGVWCSKEEDAIKSFNTAVDEARHRRRAKDGKL